MMLAKRNIKFSSCKIVASLLLCFAGLDVTVMVRSILLRGFDQEMAEKAGAYMEKLGVKFIRGAVPTKVGLLKCG